jgi:uncharacterized protein YybS (DUF2232 family)
MPFPSKGVLLDILKGCVATVALFLAYLAVPLLGLIGGIMAPLPALLYSLRSGKTAGMAIVLASAAILAVVTGPMVALFYLVQTGSVSLLMPLFMREQLSARAVAMTTLATLALIVVVGGIAVFARGANLDAEVKVWLDAALSQTSSFYAKSGIKDAELQAMQQGLKEAGELMLRVYPAMIAMSQAGVVMVNMLMIAGFARRGQLQLEIASFRDFRAPDWLIWVLIAAGFSLLIDNDPVTRVALNLLIVTLFAYLFQGVAVMTHFFVRFSVPAIGRFFFYLFLMLQPYLLVGVAALGVFDMWGNFRAPRQQNL